ncbi:MAG: PAS domain-containing protein, partial [Methermicoccaceae archaeon]
MMERRGIKTLSMIPFYVNKELAGFIGFDNILNSGRWYGKNLIIIRVIANIIGYVFERQKNEKLLKEGERRFHTLANNVPAVMFRCLNDKNYTMLYMSSEIDKVSGYPVEELLNGKMNYSDVIHPQDRQRVWDAIQKHTELDEPYEVTYRVITKSGKTRWALEKGRAIRDEKGNVLYLDGVILDITE